MYQDSDAGDSDISKCSVRFNQDFTSLIVGTKIGYRFYSLKSPQKLEKTYENSGNGIVTVERLFSSNLVVTVLSSMPNVLCIHHFRKGTEICRHKYEHAILSVCINPSHLVSVVADGVYIHSLRDMTLLHMIPNLVNHVPPSVCILSPGMPVFGQDTPSYIAYSVLGDVKIFDIVDLSIVTTISAHKNSVACAAFSHTGNQLATASEKGTVIRVFTIPDGHKRFEFRRGFKRCVTIYSLAFSADSSYLACSSNTDTVHIFHLQAESRESGSWVNYFGNLVLTSASYLPLPGADAFTQGRDFAVAKLSVNGARNVCALAVIQDVTLLLVASEIGKLYVFGLDLLEAGRSCPLLNEFQLYTSAEVERKGSMLVDRPQSGQQSTLLTEWSGPLSYASIVMLARDTQTDWKERQQRVLLDAADVINSEADESHTDCLQLNDDTEFPAIGHSAFIYL